MLRDIEDSEIEPLAIGAWILGTGGGGSPYLNYLNVRKLYAEGRRVRLMDPMDLADDDLVAVVSNMGAPLVGQERLNDPATAARAVAMMEELRGKPFRAVMSVEIGGGNGLQPLLVAAQMVAVFWARDLGVDATSGAPPLPEDYSNTRALGEVLYTQYVYPFELAAVLLLVAIVAAITLTLRQRPGLKPQDVAKQVAVRREDRVRLVKDVDTGGAGPGAGPGPGAGEGGAR